MLVLSGIPLRFVLALALVAMAVAGAADSGVKLDVPYVSQVKEGCGSASLAMVLQWWHQQGHALPVRTFDPTVIHKAVFSPAHKGSPAEALISYLEKAGYSSFPFAGEWKDLEEHLAKGRPLLAAIRTPGSRTQLHYVVLVGISAQHILLHDPARQPYLLLSRDEFEAQWKASKRWTLLTLPAK